MASYSYLEHKSGWAEIVLDRPERRNSLIPALADEVRQHLIDLQAQDDTRCILLRGNEGYFCSGIDLKALQQPDPDAPPTNGDEIRQMHLALYHCRKPVIAALERFAINAGASLAFACDLIIGGETAFLQIGEIQQGSGIPMNAAWLKIKTSEFNAARLAFYGDRLTTPELVALGLATESVADDQVVNRCREVAERIASFPAGAPETIKDALIAQRQIDNPDHFFRKPPNRALNTAAMVKE
jgi:enoyl-CoA hydratase/carnithine racemase